MLFSLSATDGLKPMDPE